MREGERKREREKRGKRESERERDRAFCVWVGKEWVYTCQVKNMMQVSKNYFLISFSNP